MRQPNRLVEAVSILRTGYIKLRQKYDEQAAQKAANASKGKAWPRR